MKKFLRRKIWKLPVWAWIGLVLVGGIAANLGDPEGETNRQIAADTSESSDTERGSSTSENTQAEAEPYSAKVLKHNDVSFATATRFADDLLIDQDTVSRDRLVATISQHAEQYRGEAHAVSVNVHSDPGEDVGAFGVWNWAPNGEWEKAEDGDPDSWDGYEWSQSTSPGKIDNPEDCPRPSERSFGVAGAYNDLTDADPTIDENVRLEQVATEQQLSVDEVKAYVAEVYEWTLC